MEQFVAGLSVYLKESYVLAFFAVYLGGVLVSFTPCIYPVIPITVAIIGSQSTGSQRRGFLLSIIYVTGMAVTYTVLGSIAALSGKLFGQMQANPWVYFVMAQVCLFMGISMLEVFTLPVRTPQFIVRAQSRVSSRGRMSTFMLGVASGFVIGPCTAPVLAVILSFVAIRQDLFYAVGLLFVFSLGMGTLLIILGAFAGLLAGLPRSGPWMTRVNHIFGWIMIAVGEYFLIQAGMLWA